MKLLCTAVQAANGQWTLRHASSDVGEVTATAATREEALEKLRGEIRYRLELCPCTGETYRHIAIEIVDAPSLASTPVHRPGRSSN